MWNVTICRVVQYIHRVETACMKYFSVFYGLLVARTNIKSVWNTHSYNTQLVIKFRILKIAKRISVGAAFDSRKIFVSELVSIDFAHLHWHSIL